MRRRLWISLVLTVVAVIGTFAANLATENTPKLGLDLQGGASVILEPVEAATSDELTVVRDLIRDELERTGIAEPDVRVQGDTIVVDLPGVRDTQEALDRVDVSGIVELRPVIGSFECDLGSFTALDQDAGSHSDDADADADADADDDSVVRERRASVDEEPVDEEPVDEEPVDEEPVGGDDLDDLVIDEGDLDELLPDDIDLDDLIPTDAPIPTTGAERLPTRDGQTLCLGPAQGTGEVFERQSATVTGNLGWGVTVGLRSGEGEAVWNALADQCFNGAPTCPRPAPNSNGQIAIVLDGVVQSAPTVNTTNFSNVVSITGQFDQSEAEDLASILNRGAFPVEMEAQEARTVSASAGSDSLRAAIIAGLVGVAIVITFLLAYYRWLALVILSGITIWALTVFSAAAFVSSATNYSLSLAGVTGIIVAVGVTVDSYIVFFERMKDEIRNGRTLKNAAPRSFKMTWRTIWSADLVSVIGAAILFWLSVGSVRGFALFLGITTLCDLFVCFFFTRPAVLLLARSKFMEGKRALGLEVVA